MIKFFIINFIKIKNDKKVQFFIKEHKFIESLFHPVNNFILIIKSMQIKNTNLFI